MQMFTFIMNYITDKNYRYLYVYMHPHLYMMFIWTWNNTFLYSSHSLINESFLLKHICASPSLHVFYFHTEVLIHLEVVFLDSMRKGGLFSSLRQYNSQVLNRQSFCHPQYQLIYQTSICTWLLQVLHSLFLVPLSKLLLMPHYLNFNSFKLTLDICWGKSLARFSYFRDASAILVSLSIYINFVIS